MVKVFLLLLKARHLNLFISNLLHLLFSFKLPDLLLQIHLLPLNFVYLVFLGAYLILQLSVVLVLLLILVDFLKPQLEFLLFLA